MQKQENGWQHWNPRSGSSASIMNGTEDDSGSQNDWIWRVTNTWELCMRVTLWLWRAHCCLLVFIPSLWYLEDSEVSRPHSGVSPSQAVAVSHPSLFFLYCDVWHIFGTDCVVWTELNSINTNMPEWPTFST